MYVCWEICDNGSTVVIPPSYFVFISVKLRVSYSNVPVKCTIGNGNLGIYISKADIELSLGWRLEYKWDI